jgi:hypothetical protein
MKQKPKQLKKFWVIQATRQHWYGHGVASSVSFESQVCRQAFKRKPTQRLKLIKRLGVPMVQAMFPGILTVEGVSPSIVLRESVVFDLYEVRL